MKPEYSNDANTYIKLTEEQEKQRLEAVLSQVERWEELTKGYEPFTPQNATLALIAWTQIDGSYACTRVPVFLPEYNTNLKLRRTFVLHMTAIANWCGGHVYIDKDNVPCIAIPCMETIHAQQGDYIVKCVADNYEGYEVFSNTSVKIENNEKID